MFLHSESHKWKKGGHKDLTIHYRGDDSLLHAFEGIQTSTNEEIHRRLKTFCTQNMRYASAIIEGPECVAAYVDHIRTWPVFYSHLKNELLISPDAQAIKALSNETAKASRDHATEFVMSGYVSGNGTLYEGIECLQPGQILFFDKLRNMLTIERYYQYTPDLTKHDLDAKAAIETLDALMDGIIKDIVVRAGNRPIWLPLSGGLDSRLIACKLHQHGARNVYTFSYGPKGNFESLIARKVARKLGYKWQSVTIPKQIQKAYFNSPERKKFWQYASGLKTIPCMREYSAIRYLHENKIMPNNAIIINGQSGDYISGGHINEFWLKNTLGTAADFFRLIINKHYDLWANIKTPANLSLVKQSIAALLPNHMVPEQAENTTMAAYSETWEYDGRQIAYVVNGQRIYEYLGYDWEMPLWDRAVVDFYENIPLILKYDQNLWKQWLRRWNYMELFPAKEPYIWRWPLPMLWVVPVANALKILGGDKLKKTFYDLMKYYGHYNNQYQYFSFAEHMKVYKNSRNVIAMLVRSFVKENPSIFSDDLKKELKL